jgi:hypothetical protein
MRRAVLLSFLCALALLAPATHADKKPAPPDAKCVAWHTEVRARAYGYDHFVILDSSCAKEASCTVSTDVNPTPQTAVVPAGAKVELATFLSSPASEFHATVACVLK